MTAVEDCRKAEAEERRQFDEGERVGASVALHRPVVNGLRVER